MERMKSEDGLKEYKTHSEGRSSISSMLSLNVILLSILSWKLLFCLGERCHGKVKNRYWNVSMNKCDSGKNLLLSI